MYTRTDFITVIQELESKFAEDFNQNTFDEINRLKKEQNIN